MRNPRFSLLLMVALVAVAGCSESYNGERLYWHAQQREKEIVKDPGMATPAQYATAITAFERVIKDAPSTSWAAQAQFMVGSLYALQKDFTKARAAYALVLQNYNRFQQMALNARLAIARTYEDYDPTSKDSGQFAVKPDNLEPAIKAYRDIADYHPYSEAGMQALLRIGSVLERFGKPGQAEDAYAGAARTYQKLIATSPSPAVTLQVKTYLIAAYQKLQQWEQAAKALEDVATAPEGVNRPFVLLTLASMYDNKLKDPIRAQQAYERMVTEFPKHPLAKAAQMQLDRLRKTSKPSGTSEPALTTAPAVGASPGAP